MSNNYDVTEFDIDNVKNFALSLNKGDAILNYAGTIADGRMLFNFDYLSNSCPNCKSCNDQRFDDHKYEDDKNLLDGYPRIEVNPNYELYSDSLGMINHSIGNLGKLEHLQIKYNIDTYFMSYLVMVARQLKRGQIVKCTICMSDDIDFFSRCSLKCGHIFHDSCLSEYLDKSSNRYPKSCPLCRSLIIDDYFLTFVRCFQLNFSVAMTSNEIRSFQRMLLAYSAMDHILFNGEQVNQKEK